jgi:D-glutamate cyclase
LLRRRELVPSLFDIKIEREYLRIMVEQGPLVDGVTAQPTVTVDGLSFEEYVKPLMGIRGLLGI